MFARAALETGRLVWLLTLTVRGKVYRFSTEPLVVSNSDPQTGPDSFQFVAGLEFTEYEDTVALFDSEASSREVSLSVLFQQAQSDGWDAITDPTRDIGAGRGELALLVDGDDYTDRQIVVVGYIEQPTHGGRYEPVDFTLTESDFNDTARFPPRGAFVGKKTWPNTIGAGTGHTLQRDDEADGQFYPFVFGQPGEHAPTTWHGRGTGKMAGTPALLVSMDTTDEDNESHAARFVIAGHETFGTGTVTIFHLDHKLASTVATAHRADGRGRTVTTIDLAPALPTTGLGVLDVFPGTEVWIAWTGRGGIPNRDRSGPLLGAGEIIEYLLGQSRLRIDTLRSRVVLNEINGYELDFWVNEQRSPWDIIKEDILPIVPLSPQIRPDGLGFVYWNWQARQSDAVCQIDIDRDFGERTSSVEVSPVDNVYSQARIDYCQDGPGGKFRKHLTYTHTSDSDDPSIIRNPYSWASFTRYGIREGLTIEAPAVARDDTARAILDWKIAYHSQTHRKVSYRLGQEMQILEVGEVVTLTDSDINWTDVVCLITGITRVPGYTDITLTTVSDWSRDGMT